MERFQKSIRCRECQHVFDSPVILPCGESICEKHVQAETCEYTCVACKQVHLIPPSGFTNNKALTNILNSNIEKIHFSPDYDEAVESCRKLAKCLGDLAYIDSNLSNVLDKTINEFKREVSRLTEEHKLKLDKHASELLLELNKYDSECKTNLTSSEFTARWQMFQAEMKKIELELNSSEQCLDSLDTNVNEWGLIREKSATDITNLEVKLNRFLSELFMRKFSFFKNRLKDYQQFKLISNRK
jgi:hypothetical protein